MDASRTMNPTALFNALHLTVLQRDWLSSNQIVFRGPEGAAVVDTGYATHAAQTMALLESVLGTEPLLRILNTHLHSDHCGGNAALQARWPQARTLVPQAAMSKAQEWDEDRLTYRLTGQRCDRFQVDEALLPGTSLTLGGQRWEVHATGGHDPEAVVLFEPTQRVLISGDALWRDKVAIIFPELDGDPGFDEALRSLDLIEALNPEVVIPGHGAPFVEVADALSISRNRLRKLQAHPALHARHALRVLMVFHLMEHRRRPAQDLCEWMAASPLARREAVGRLMEMEPPQMARHILGTLIEDGVVAEDGPDVVLA